MLTLTPFSSNCRGQVSSTPLPSPPGEKGWGEVTALPGWPWHAHATASAVSKTRAPERGHSCPQRRPMEGKGWKEVQTCRLFRVAADRNVRAPDLRNLEK